MIRGYLQGLDFVGVIATSEVIEQITRSVVLLWLISYYATYNVEASVGGANLGAPAGACAALIFVLLFLYRLQKNTHIMLISHKILQPKFQHPAFVFFQTSIAITCTRLIFPLSDFLDALIIPHRLQDAGFVPAQAIAIYGEMSGMAVTLAYLPTLFTAAISHVLTSKFSSDWKSGKQRRMKRRASLAIQITVIWGTACSLIMYLYAPDFSWMMLGSSEITGAIRYLAIAPLLCGLREILTCIHWSTGNHQKPLWGLIVAVILSLISYYSLITLPGFAYLGIAIGILAIDFIGLCWNSHRFMWYPKRKTVINWLQKVSWCLVLVSANYFILMYFFPEDGGTQYGIRLLKIFLAFSTVLLFLFLKILKGRFNLIE